MIARSPQDDRIVLRFGTVAEAGPGDALLLEGAEAAPTGRTVARFSAATSHGVLCGCCGGRDPAAVALGGLFLARARGQVPWFTGVVAVVADSAAVLRAVQSDLVAAARFRVQG